MTFGKCDTVYLTYKLIEYNINILIIVIRFKNKVENMVENDNAFNCDLKLKYQLNECN